MRSVDKHAMELTALASPAAIIRATPQQYADALRSHRGLREERQRAGRTAQESRVARAKVLVWPLLKWLR